MKKMLPESELARDERFVRTNIEDRLFDPRGPKIAQRNTGPAKMGVDRPAAGERSRSLMHGIFVGEIQALEGAGRTCYDFDDETAPFQLKLDMARQCWDESRHCEISVKLGDHMGAEIGEYTESTFLFAAACNPDPVFRLCGVNRALEGLAIDVFNSMKDFGNESGDPILEFCEDWMLADEVTHVKMGSDWLRRLTETDPDRRERALEFQRTVDAIFNLGGFRGEDDENPIQLARDFRRLAGFTDDENDSLAALARESTEQAREMAEAATAALDASANKFVSAITVTPARFTLIAYDADEIKALAEEAAALAGISPGVDIALTVDEELFAPLNGHMSDVVDGKIVAWISGGNFEDNKRPTHFSADQARVDLAIDDVARQGSALRRLRGRAARRRALAAASARPGTPTRSAGRFGSASTSAGPASSTTSGSSTASPTSPMPRSSGAGTPSTSPGKASARSARRPAPPTAVRPRSRSISSARSRRTLPEVEERS